MRQYLDLIQTVLDQGFWQENRTGVRTLNLPGAMMRFDLTQGFPAVTTKRLAFKSVVGELIGFLRAVSSAEDFRSLGCKVWDQNANDNAQWLANPFRQGEDDLGPIYGVQWRQWPAYKTIDLSNSNGSEQLAMAKDAGYVQIGVQDDQVIVLYKAIDQLRLCLDMIMTDPDSRRILFHGWNCAALDEMALPPCHLLYQFLPNKATKEISLCLYIRSNDLGLGAPFNVASASILLHLVGRLTGYTPKYLTYFVGSAHIYENHLEMLEEQLSRTPHALPRLCIEPNIPEYAKTGVYEPQWLEKVNPEDFWLDGYTHHAPLSAPMAV